MPSRMVLWNKAAVCAGESRKSDAISLEGKNGLITQAMIIFFNCLRKCGDLVTFFSKMSAMMRPRACRARRAHNTQRNCMGRESKWERQKEKESERGRKRERDSKRETWELVRDVLTKDKNSRHRNDHFMYQTVKLELTSFPCAEVYESTSLHTLHT